MDTLLSKHWHHLPRDEIATLLESDAAKGLDIFEVAHRQTHFGPNRLTLKKGISPLLLFLLQLNQPLVYILQGAAVYGQNGRSVVWKFERQTWCELLESACTDPVEVFSGRNRIDGIKVAGILGASL